MLQVSVSFPLQLTFIAYGHYYTTGSVSVWERIFFSLQVTDRWGKSSWNSWLIVGFLVNTAPGWKLQHSKRHQHASMASYKVETVRVWNCRLTLDQYRLLFHYDVALWLKTRVFFFLSFFLPALIPVMKLSTILHENFYYTVLNHCSPWEQKHKIQMA